MVIDERKEHIRTNYQQARSEGKATDSDHFTEYLDIHLNFESVKPDQVEFYNFKYKKSQVMFRELTTETNEFTKCFTVDGSLEVQIEDWRRVLNTHCRNSFKKI